MRPAEREAQPLSRFYAGLRADILAAWQSQPGYAYDRVIYAVEYPYSESDIAHVLEWCGRGDERRHLPGVETLNRTLEAHDYPGLAGLAPEGVSAQAWSAVLHFCDPSYPVYTEEAADALAALGYRTRDARGTPDYATFLSAVDELKVGAPVASIPETNWYLARNIGVGLEGWWRAKGRGASAVALSSR